MFWKQRQRREKVFVEWTRSVNVNEIENPINKLLFTLKSIILSNCLIYLYAFIKTKEYIAIIRTNRSTKYKNQIPICKVVKISYFTLGSSDINKAYRCVGNTRTKSGFWLSLWYLRFTAFDYPFGILDLRLLIITLVS